MKKAQLDQKEKLPKKKRLLIATDAYIPRWDGIARYLSEIIPHLTDRYDIRIIAPTFPGYEDYKDPAQPSVKRIATYPLKFGDYCAPRFEPQLIKEEVKKADIVWTHAVMPIGMLSVIYAHRYKIPVISTIHSLEWELAQRSLSRRNIFRNIAKHIARLITKHIYNRADLLIVPDKEVGEKLLLNNIRTEKAVVHLGTDIKKFCPPKNKKEAKKKLGLNPDKIVIGYAGRVGREKDIPTLLNAFRKIRNDKLSASLLVVGDGVKEETDILRTEKSVHYFPNKDDIVPFYQAMDIYVLPSLTETTSLSTMEAMSTGIPAVATPVGSVKHYVQERVNGIFFPKSNSLVLSLKLRWLIKNEGARLAMGQMARRTIVEKYRWEKTVSQIQQVFSDF